MKTPGQPAFALFLISAPPCPIPGSARGPGENFFTFNFIFMSQQILQLFDVPPSPIAPTEPTATRKRGMGSHQSADMQSDVWLTPPSILHRLGDFDLDPCAPAIRPWNMAKKHYSLPQNGLSLPWEGRVWLNPPYGRFINQWMHKMAQHAKGIALIFARTDVAFWHRYIWPHADSILFLEGRLHFYNIDGTKAAGNAGAPSVLIAYGRDNVDALGDSGIPGKHLLVNLTPVIIVGISPSWKSVLSIALDRADGEAAMKEIYNLVEAIAPDKCEKNDNWKPKVRQQLQEHFVRIAKGLYRKPTVVKSPITKTPL